VDGVVAEVAEGVGQGRSAGPAETYAEYPGTLVILVGKKEAVLETLAESAPSPFGWKTVEWGR